MTANIYLGEKYFPLSLQEDNQICLAFKKICEYQGVAYSFRSYEDVMRFWKISHRKQYDLKLRLRIKTLSKVISKTIYLKFTPTGAFIDKWWLDNINNSVSNIEFSC